MTKIYPDSEVELESWMARYYDTILNLATLGLYPFFIRKVVGQLNINPNDKILDFGAGTGRNALLMEKHISQEGEIIGLDIGTEMIEQFQKKTSQFDNLKIRNQRIDQPLEYRNEFDKVFISFVLHGFPNEIRQQVISNAYQALKPGGSFAILDYNEFHLDDMSLFTRIPFKIIECPYAFDFIARNWKNILREYGFRDFQENLFFFNYVRLLETQK